MVLHFASRTWPLPIALKGQDEANGRSSERSWRLESLGQRAPAGTTVTRTKSKQEEEGRFGPPLAFQFPSSTA